jgi:hypothetical protein
MAEMIAILFAAAESVALVILVFALLALAMIVLSALTS